MSNHSDCTSVKKDWRVDKEAALSAVCSSQMNNKAQLIKDCSYCYLADRWPEQESAIWSMSNTNKEFSLSTHMHQEWGQRHGKVMRCSQRCVFFKHWWTRRKIQVCCQPVLTVCPSLQYVWWDYHRLSSNVSSIPAWLSDVHHLNREKLPLFLQGDMNYLLLNSNPLLKIMLPRRLVGCNFDISNIGILYFLVWLSK